MKSLNNISELKELTSKLSILYVEDEDSIRQPIYEILSIFFKEVMVAKDGLDGLGVYLENKDNIDLIISDINMPNMNGLDMIEEIRKENREVPIIISTAYNEQQYFLKSIELKIDKYLLKPIKQERLIETINDIARNIDDKNTLKKLLEEKRKVELQEKEMQTIQALSNSYASPAIIFHNGKAKHFSEPFIKLFEDRKDMTLEDITIDTQTMFRKQKGCLKSFAHYDAKNELNNKVVVPQKVGQRIFRVQKQSTPLYGGSDIFILIDITLEEYQKIKIDSFAEALTDMLIESKSKRILHEDKEVTEKTVNDLVPKKVVEIENLDQDFSNAIIKLEYGDYEQVRKISTYISQYADTYIHHLEDFIYLYVVTKDLANLLATVELDAISDLDAFASYLTIIREDLSFWKENIFTQTHTEDIHSLDSSIINTSLEIEILLLDKQQDLEDDEDVDLEFF